MSQDRGPSYGRRQAAEPRMRQAAAQQAPQTKRRTALDEDREEGVEQLREALEDVVGAEQWKRSKFRYFFGAGGIRGPLSSLRGVFGGSYSRGRGLYDAAIGRMSEDDVQPVLETDAGRRFAMSMVEHGKSDEDINVIIDNTYRGFRFYAAVMAAVMVIGALSYLYSPPSVQGWWLLDAIFRFMLIVPMGAFAFQHAYTNWMMRRRRYDGALDYLRSGDLLPRKADRKRSGPRGRSLAKVAALLVAVGVSFAIMGYSGAAFAQTTTPVTTTSNPNTSAMTGPQDIFKVPDGSKDLFMKLMSFLAPNTGPVPGLLGQSGATTPAHGALAAAFMAFISALFFLATMQVAWHTISGIVATAQEGKVLGQRWHQVWAPVRVVTGVGFLAPAFNGFCVAQILVLYLMAFGGQLANILWSPYVDTITSGIAAGATDDSTVTDLFGNLVSTNEIVHDVFKHELCFQTVKQNYQRRGYSGGALPQDPTWKEEWTTTIATPVLSSLWSLFGGGSGSDSAAPSKTTSLMGIPLLKSTLSGQTLNYGPICGSVTVPTIASGASTTGGTNNPDLDAITTFSAARKNAVDQVRNDVKDLATKAGQSYQNYQAATASGSSTSGPYFSVEQVPAQNNGSSVSGGSLQEATTAFEKARTDYNDTMTKAAVDLVKRNSVQGSGQSSMLDTFKQQAKDGGWATAGLYYMTLSRIQGSLFTAASEKPQMADPNIQAADEQLRPILEGNAANNVPGALTQFDQWWNDNITPLSGAAAGKFDPNGAAAGLTTPKDTSLFAKLMSLFDVKTLGTTVRAWSLINPLNAMGELTLLGHKIISSAMLLFAGYLAAAAGGAALSFGVGTAANIATAGMASTILGAFLTPITAFFVLLITMLLGFGIVLAYVIPMIPYIMVLFFIVGMLTLLAEALIAAPLWAFFHCRMDGQEFVDQVQRPGYMIAFNLLLRPSLMLLGLFMSFFIHGALTWFLSVTFGPAVAGATAGFGSGPIAFVVLLGIFAFLNFQIAIRSFQLITQVPDRVTRWFGYGGEHLGESEHGHQAGNVVAGVVSARSGELLRGAGAAGALRRPGAGGGTPPAIPRAPGAGMEAIANKNTENAPSSGSRGGGGEGDRSGSPARSAGQVPDVPDRTSGGGEQSSSDAQQSQGGGQGGDRGQHDHIDVPNKASPNGSDNGSSSQAQPGTSPRGGSSRGGNNGGSQTRRNFGGE